MLSRPQTANTWIQNEPKKLPPEGRQIPVLISGPSGNAEARSNTNPDYRAGEGERPASAHDAPTRPRIHVPTTRWRIEARPCATLRSFPGPDRARPRKESHEAAVARRQPAVPHDSRGWSQFSGAKRRWRSAARFRT